MLPQKTQKQQKTKKKGNECVTTQKHFFYSYLIITLISRFHIFELKLNNNNISGYIYHEGIR